jgi:catechol-2,3-dioxygenase
VRLVRLHHLAFRTHDLARLENFYVSVVGLAVVERHTPRSVWLRAGETLLMLETATPDEPEYPRESLDLVAFALPSDARADTLKRFAQHGVAVEASTAFTLYVRDPDGRRIGLSSYPAPLT